MSLYTFPGRFYSSSGSTFLSQYSCIKHDSYDNPDFKEGHKQNDFSASNYAGHSAILLLVGVFSSLFSYYIDTELYAAMSVLFCTCI